ncbi:MAG: helix-turn-helix transcriptional regulator [Megamonas funiformis]|jgi:predicted transcriptional regulator|uniref:helix-turn-helix domain-containing protein n=1 Tax=Megamonas funiformis TaxID=437897 RepID=UPI001EB3D184|nr:helix-turn-helix transcriptional regulator [Megamonas funiformis]MBS7212539.1 helix-turn-helix transcriptional regulator [Megamonas funiformis]
MNDIKINNLRIAIINELIRAREEQGISQKKLEELSGVKQPVIARIEKGKSSPNTDTLVKLLTPLGKKLVIVPLESIENTK